MPKDLIELVYTNLHQEQAKEKASRKRKGVISDRAEYTDGAIVMAYADLPTEGLGNSINFVTFLFVSNGRKPGEGAGAGTGVFAYWDDIAQQWKNMHDYAQVVI